MGFRVVDAVFQIWGLGFGVREAKVYPQSGAGSLGAGMN